MLHFISIHENITWLVNPHSYANLREDGDPIAGACMQRHNCSYQQPYVNMTSLNKPYFAKLRLFNQFQTGSGMHGDRLMNWGNMSTMYCVVE